MQNTFSQSGNDSKWFLKKSFFKIGKWHSRPPRDPPPFMANAILNFHFDFLTPSLIQAMKYIEKSRSGDKQFVHSLITLEDVFCRPHPKISWAMMDHLPTISGYAATLVIPWREFWSENTIGVDKLGIFWPKFGAHQRLEMTIFSSPSPDITRG